MAVLLPPLSAAELAALPIFPLPEAALFPSALLPLHVFEPRYRELVRDALAGTKVLAVARLRPGFETEYAGRPPVFEICGAGRIVEHRELPDGRYHIALRGISRVRILEELPPERAYRLVKGEVLADLPYDVRLVAAFEIKVQSLWQLLAPKLPEPLRDLGELTRSAAGAGEFSDRLAATLVGDPETSQALLSEPDPCERLRLVAERLQAVADSIVPPGTDPRSRAN